MRSLNLAVSEQIALSTCRWHGKQSITSAAWPASAGSECLSESNLDLAGGQTQGAALRSLGL